MVRRLLMIDDDRLQYRLTAGYLKSLKRESYVLEWEATYEHGLARLLEEPFDACLLDYQLGPRDGLELIREAVKAGCRTPIIFLTADASEEVDTAAMEAGALDYLVKGDLTPRALARSLRYSLKLAETMAELKRLAIHDQLTGLFNRREFDRFLAEECDRAVRFRRGMALVLIDLDKFKSVNDTHGHQAGDVVLQETARRLAKPLRESDRLARFGGEEFAIVLVEVTREEALEIGERLRQTMAASSITVSDGLALPVTISVGVAISPTHGSVPSGLIAAADAALYQAKGEGRNRVVAAS